jgi:hypothetical protein
MTYFYFEPSTIFDAFDVRTQTAFLNFWELFKSCALECMLYLNYGDGSRYLQRYLEIWIISYYTRMHI